MSNTAYPERRQFGTTTIEVSDEDFFDGYQAGMLLYRLGLPGHPLTDQALASFLTFHAPALVSSKTSERFRAGFLSGWFAALYGYHLPAPETLPAQEVHP